MFKTQLSSKYSPENTQLFELKRRLIVLGVEVAFPAGDSVLDYVHEFAITVPHEGTTPFHSTQSAFLGEVAKNPLHIVYNIREGVEGYIGESAATEIAYALMLDKPIMRIRDEIVFGDRVAAELRKIVMKNLHHLPVKELDKITSEEVIQSLKEHSSQTIKYELTDADRAAILEFVRLLNEKYEQAWEAFQADRQN